MQKNKLDVSEFAFKVISIIRQIPKGKVATYSQIARLAGKEHAARGVSWILHSCSKKYRLPWQRVLNSKGKISFHPTTQNFQRQKRILQSEGIVFSTNDQLELRTYQWKKKVSTKKQSRKSPTMFS